MDIKSIVKGVTFGTAAGLICYTMSAASSGKKKSLKRNAGKNQRREKYNSKDYESRRGCHDSADSLYNALR